jgi:hypothetical protein
MGTRKSLLLAVVLALILTVLVLPEMVYAVSALDGFDPNADECIRSIAIQADRKILALYKYKIMVNKILNCSCF